MVAFVAAGGPRFTQALVWRASKLQRQPNVSGAQRSSTPPGPEHATQPGRHTHAPREHTVPAGQTRAHPPQLLVSICSSTHSSPHKTHSSPQALSEHAIAVLPDPAMVTVPALAVAPEATVMPDVKLPVLASTARTLPLALPAPEPPKSPSRSSSKPVRSPQLSESSAKVSDARNVPRLPRAPTGN